MSEYMSMHLEASVLRIGRENVIRVWAASPNEPMEEYSISFEHVPVNPDEADDVWLKAVLEAAIKAL